MAVFLGKLVMIEVTHVVIVADIVESGLSNCRSRSTTDSERIDGDIAEAKHPNNEKNFHGDYCCL